MENYLLKVWENLPDKPELLPIFYAIKKELSKIQLQNTKKRLYRAQAIAQGDFALGSKEFFDQFSKTRTNTTIEALSNSHGKLPSETKEILETAHDFYQRLYSENPRDPEATKHFLNPIQQRNKIENSLISKSISEEELHGVIKEMAANKSPGPDGISIEFYK